MTVCTRARCTLLIWFLGLVSAIAALVRIGADHPGSPPVDRPLDWSAWIEAREPLDAIAGIARLAATALLGLLLLATILQLVVTMQPSARRRRAPRRVAPRFVATLAAAVVASTSTAMAGEAQTVPAPSDSVSLRPGLGASMQLVDPDTETSMPWANGVDAGDDLPEEPAANASGRELPDPPAARERIVRPGDHLWSIAEDVVTEATGLEPSDDAVHRYWVQLIDANRDRLVDPDNPDLVLPGQRFRLP